MTNIKVIDCKRTRYKEWQDRSEARFSYERKSPSKQLTYVTMQMFKFKFYEVDRKRLRDALHDIEKRIKNIRRNNLLSDFHLLLSLKRSARWMNGALTLMNGNVPPIGQFQTYGYGVDSLGYKGTVQVYQEICDFVRNQSHTMKNYTFTITQMAGC